MPQTKKTSPDKKEKMYLVGKILTPVGVGLLLVGIILMITSLAMEAIPEIFMVGLFGLLPLGLATLITGIVLLVKGKKALPHKIKKIG